MSSSRTNTGKTTKPSIGKFLKSRSKYFHTSARVAMHQNPDGVMYPAVPWIQKPGRTYHKKSS